MYKLRKMVHPGACATMEVCGRDVIVVGGPDSGSGVENMFWLGVVEWWWAAGGGGAGPGSRAGPERGGESLDARDVSSGRSEDGSARNGEPMRMEVLLLLSVGVNISDHMYIDEAPTRTRKTSRFVIGLKGVMVVLVGKGQGWELVFEWCLYTREDWWLDSIISVVMISINIIHLHHRSMMPK